MHRQEILIFRVALEHFVVKFVFILIKDGFKTLFTYYRAGWTMEASYCRAGSSQDFKSLATGTSKIWTFATLLAFHEVIIKIAFINSYEFLLPHTLELVGHGHIIF